MAFRITLLFFLLATGCTHSQKGAGSPRDEICLTRDEALRIELFKIRCQQEKNLAALSLEKEKKILRIECRRDLDKEILAHKNSAENLQKCVKLKECKASPLPWILLGVSLATGATIAILVWRVK